MTTSFGGMVQLHIDDGCGWMDKRGTVEPSGTMVASTVARLGKVDAAVPTLKIDWWQVAAAASYSAGVLVEECAGLVGAPYPIGVLVEECAGLVGAPYPAGVLVGTSVLNVRFGCDVCLVLSPDYQRPFINWLGVAIDVA
ncbi:hypothetical protein VPH35_022132 [Triticum aestivum]